MLTKHHYIIIGMSVVIVYLVYLISYYKFNQFKTDNFIAAIEQKNAQIQKENEEKDIVEEYIHTKAYQTQIAKATQNKKLPGEEIINVIRQEDADGNKDMSAHSAIDTIKQQTEDPTAHMSNPEKWMYLIEKGIR